MSGALAVGVAVRPGEGGAEWRRALHWAGLAEELGLHSLWVPEGHFQRGALASPLVALAACAARTRRLRLGTTSLLLPVLHPLRVAAEVATLDRLSEGRVLLGLGRGFRRPVFKGFGVEAVTKRDRFDAALDAILEAWTDPDSPLRPVQRPHPPLVVAAFGPKGLRQAAARGLPYLASPLEALDALQENWTLWREHAAGAGQGTRLPGAPSVPVMRSVFVARDEAEAGRVRAGLEREMARLGPAVPKALERAARGALEDRVVVGCGPEVIDGVERYREALGMDLLVVRAEAPGVPPEASEESLARLVADVLPKLGASPALTPRAPRA